MAKHANSTTMASDRRGFLRGLVSLPLIGGGVTLIGAPTAVAEPITYDLLQAYKTWLEFERRSVSWDLADHPKMVAFYGDRRERRFEAVDRHIVLENTGDVRDFHYDAPRASSRAALVLSTVGCDWRSS